MQCICQRGRWVGQIQSNLPLRQHETTKMTMGGGPPPNYGYGRAGSNERRWDSLASHPCPYPSQPPWTFVVVVEPDDNPSISIIVPLINSIITGTWTVVVTLQLGTSRNGIALRFPRTVVAGVDRHTFQHKHTWTVNRVVGFIPSQYHPSQSRFLSSL